MAYQPAHAVDLVPQDSRSSGAETPPGGGGGGGSKGGGQDPALWSTLTDEGVAW